MVGASRGHCDPAFADVRELFESSLADGRDLGAAVAVFVDGRPVVDLWGGIADQRSGREWEADTPCIAFSSGKAVTAAAALAVMARAGIEPETPVVRWWPEFGAAGKDTATTEQLFTHSVGLPVIERTVTVAQAADPAAMAAELAGQTPLWEPGARHGYHALTYGWLVGELVRRVSGRTVGEFVRENFIGADADRGPGGSDGELWFAPPAEVVARSARFEFQPAEQPAWRPAESPTQNAVIARLAAAYRDRDSLLMRSSTNPRGSHNDPAVLAGGWPGSGLVATARGLAAFYRDLLSGALIPGALLREARRERVRGADEVTILESAFGLGFMLPSQTFLLPEAAHATAFGHPGMGGSVGSADPDRGVAFAFIPNLRGDALAGDRRAHDLLAAVYAAL